MLEEWILNQIDPLRPDSLILVRDPQRVIQKGAWVVDGWAEQNGYTVFFCVGNLGLREMVETVRDDAQAKILLVDRSREDARSALFYPDLDAQVPARNKLRLSLRDFLIHATGDPRWPRLVEERRMAELVLAHLEGTLQAHRYLRQVDSARFTDTDLRKVVMGAALKINPFRQLSPSDIRRLCVEQHRTLESLRGALSGDVMVTLRRAIAEAPKPFCHLLERDPEDVIRAFTLAAIMHQHGLEYQVLLPALDPALHEYREIAPSFLESAMADQLHADPERVADDVRAVESFLVQAPASLAFLLRDRLGLDEPEHARAVLERERLSPLVRSLALASLLLDLLARPESVSFHQEVERLLEEQAHVEDWPALRRPTEAWQALEQTYRRAIEVSLLLKRMAKVTRPFRVTSADELRFETFARLWDDDRVSHLDFYISDLDRALRIGNVVPVPQKALWPELATRWEQARNELQGTKQAINELQALVDARFQDLYHLRYDTWIHEEDAPAVFTHQFLDRVLKPHWDPQSGRKAVVMVFDGLRVDAWHELLRPIFEERFQVIQSYPGSALIPTETHLSRKAIAAGCLPDRFTSQSELQLLVAWLKQWLGHKAPYLEVVKDEDTAASGITVRHTSDALDYIVFNFTDSNLHHTKHDLAFIYNTVVHEIIRQDVRSVLRDLPDDAVLFVTSDHGFVPMPERTITVPDRLVGDASDVTYRNARARAKLEHPEVLAFDARKLSIPTVSGSVAYDTVLFPRPGYILRREKRHSPSDPYSHGGISLAECLVPMVVLGPKQDDRPVLSIERIEQTGSNSEGEALTLEVRIVAEVPVVEKTISLTFSREELPMHREVFVGRQAVYPVQWTPRLPDITEEDRDQGAIRLALTVVLSYRDKGRMVRTSKSTEIVVKLDPNRLRRRVDSKLDFMMGKVPKGFKS